MGQIHRALATMGLGALFFVAFLAFAVVVDGQAPGSAKVNSFLNMAIEECTGQENCNRVSTKVTLDANWRWIHEAGGTTNCYDGNIWDNSFCPDPATCNANCEMEGCESADWAGTYGVTASGSDLSLTFVTTGQYSTNIGSRNYLMDPSGTNYYMFKLKNKEFTFDVDNSQGSCQKRFSGFCPLRSYHRHQDLVCDRNDGKKNGNSLSTISGVPIQEFEKKT